MIRGIDRSSKLITLFIVAVLGVFIINGCTSNSTPVSMGELDSLKLVTLDSTQFQLTTSDMRGALLAVVFNPWCEHCQAEAEEIHHNMKKLENVTIVMIGSVNLQAIKDFSVKYGLNNFKNVKFAYASPVATYNLLGAYQLPHMRLYDKDMKPLKDFTSTTSVDNILSQIK